MWIKFAPWIACVVLSGLWLNARDAVIEERERCNVDKLAAIVEAETITRTALQAAHAREIAQLARQAEAKDRALEIASEELERATRGTVAHENTITRLELEASIDDIPDSKECLNVFALESSLAGLYVQPEDCGEAGAGGGSWTGAVCSGPEAVDRADSASGDFSDVTYADTLKLWGRDRVTIQILNGRLAAIESLGEEVEQ